MSFFAIAWKHMAELDDFLAEQAAEATERITDRFARKQTMEAVAAVTNNFRLRVIVRKESIAVEDKVVHECASLELSLPPVSQTASREAYMKTVELLREATKEAMALPPVLTRTVVRFRWARKYRYPPHAIE